eukprot:UN11735
MVNECFMGSAFVGMVHFLKKETTKAKASASSESAVAGMKFTALMGAIAGDSSVASSAARKASSMASQGEFDVKFNMMVLGYCPPIENSDLQNTVKQFADFDPGKFKIDMSDEQESDAGEGKATAKGMMQAARQANMKAVISATVESVADKSGMKVLDFNTFMDAFNDYCTNAPNKDGVGIPIGLNIRSWTKDQICQILWKKYIVSGAVPGLAETYGGSTAETAE